jgi:hypothetical protein
MEEYDVSRLKICGGARRLHWAVLMWLSAVVFPVSLLGEANDVPSPGNDTSGRFVQLGSAWGLRQHDDGEGRVLLHEDRRDEVRVEVDSAGTEPWHVQLERNGFTVRSRHRYLVSFRARADQVRKVGVAVKQAHAPWEDLGFYQNVELTTDWQDYSFEFEAKQTDGNAGLSFDIGTSDIAFELTLLRLKSVTIARFSDLTRTVVTVLVTACVVMLLMVGWRWLRQPSVPKRPASPKTRVQGKLTTAGVWALIVGLCSVLHLFFWGLSLPNLASLNLNALGLFLALAVSTTALALSYRCGRMPSRRAVSALVALFSIQTVLFLGGLLYGSAAAQHRVLAVAIIFFSIAAVAAVLLSRSRRISAGQASLVSLSAAAAMLVGETVLGINTQSVERENAQVRLLSGGQFFVPHPVLEHVYAPNALAKGCYPDNPRAYFRNEKLFGPLPLGMFALTEQNGATARLSFPVTPTPLLRVDAINSESTQPGDLSLTCRGFPLELANDYVVKFNARADNPRPVVVVVRQGSAPWENIGLRQRIELAADWSAIQLPFQCTRSCENATVVLNLAASPEAVEFSGIEFYPRDESLVSNPTIHSITYKTNSIGFRDHEYAVSRPKGVVRIVCLGDSYTFGEGVHFEDLYTKRLERRLNTPTDAQEVARRYEVMGFGVQGYNTRQERQCFELIASRFQPQLVLVVMVANDDISHRDEVRLGLQPDSRGNQGLLRIPSAVQRARYQLAGRDFSVCLEELEKLAALCQQQNARLGVVIFRNDNDESWERLSQVISAGLRDTAIPLLDLVDKLLAEHTREELIVHKLDGHPNEIAHRIAAEEIQRFLFQKGLLDADEQTNVTSLSTNSH